MESVSNLVFELRNRRDLTQQNLADAVGVSRQTIISLEKGNYMPTLSVAMKISKYFRKPLEEIFFLQQ